MPEPLVCEDSNLTRLLQTVHSRPGARILYQDTVRRGGVLGFFAREVHRVAYQVPAETDPATGSDFPAGTAAAVEVAVLSAEPVTLVARPCPPAPNSFEAILRSFDAVSDELGLPGAGSDAIAELLAETDAVERARAEQAPSIQSIQSTESTESTPRDDDPSGFAELLHRLTIADPDEPRETAAEAPAILGNTAEPAGGSRPAPAANRQPMAAVTAIGRPEARNRLEMLMQLRQIGVPVSVNPRSETHNLYQALEDILQELPPPAEPPRQAGAVLAIVGESTPALRAARTAAAMLRIPENTIGVAGLPAEAATALGCCHLSGAREAERVRQELSLADTPSIVVVATDGAVADPADPWAAQLLAALAPTATWAVIDARWKTEDSRDYLDRIGTVDALAVHAAELSSSPASVWDLDLPLALLDGRSPTTFAWTGLLFQLLATGARHRASA